MTKQPKNVSEVVDLILTHSFSPQDLHNAIGSLIEQLRVEEIPTEDHLWRAGWNPAVSKLNSKIDSILK